MKAPTHSEKTLETLRQMGCTTTGWDNPPIEWKTVTMPVPTRVRCPRCQGRGQVTGADGGRLGRCPTCPPRRNWPSHGSGEVTELVEREVEVGTIVWPTGTRFDSRFAGRNQCELCAKTISNFVPVLGVDAAGHHHGMWVGEDCARTLLGVSLLGTPIELAATQAKAAKAARGLWREVPKAPKPVKPATPALVNPATKDELDAIARAAFGLQLITTQYNRTRAELTYAMLLAPTPESSRMWFEVKVSARHGVTVKTDYGEPTKPFLKDRDRQDAVSALEDTLPAIARHGGLHLLNRAR